MPYLGDQQKQIVTIMFSFRRCVAGLSLAVVVASFAGVESAEACSRVFSTCSANGRAMVVGRTIDLYFNDKPALALRPRGLSANGMLDNRCRTH